MYNLRLLYGRFLVFLATRRIAACCLTSMSGTLISARAGGARPGRAAPPGHKTLIIFHTCVRGAVWVFGRGGAIKMGLVNFRPHNSSRRQLGGVQWFQRSGLAISKCQTFVRFFLGPRGGERLFERVVHSVCIVFSRPLSLIGSKSEKVRRRPALLISAFACTPARKPQTHVGARSF